MSAKPQPAPISLGSIFKQAGGPEQQSAHFRDSMILTAQKMKREGIGADVIVSGMLAAAIALAHGAHIDLPQIEEAIRHQYGELDQARAAKG